MRKQAMLHSLEVANRVLDVADKLDVPLTMMHLQKLIYFAHGWHWAVFNRPLTRDLPEVWQYGPVYVDVYEEFKEFRGEAITGRACINAKGTTSETDELLTDVVSNYGTINAYRLSAMTHAEDSPWDITRSEKGYFEEISNEVIKKFFDAKLKAK